MSLWISHDPLQLFRHQCRFPIPERLSPSQFRCELSSSFRSSLNKVKHFCLIQNCPTYREGYKGTYNLAIWRDFSRAFKDNKYYLFIYQIKGEIGSGSGFGAGPLFQISKKKVENLCIKYPNYAPCLVAEMCPIFRYDTEKDKVEGSAFHSWVYWLLDNFGNQEAVLDGLHANMCSFGCIGSLIPLLVQRKECLKKIEKHQRPEVRRWVEQCIKDVDEEYTRENNREEYIRLHY